MCEAEYNVSQCGGVLQGVQSTVTVRCLSYGLLFNFSGRNFKEGETRVERNKVPTHDPHSQEQEEPGPSPTLSDGAGLGTKQSPW